MKIDAQILKFIKNEKPDLEISGLRGLVKTSENEWSFCFTYRDEDFLSISDLVTVHFDGYSVLKIVNDKKTNKKSKQKKIA